MFRSDIRISEEEEEGQSSEAGTSTASAEKTPETPEIHSALVDLQALNSGQNSDED